MINHSLKTALITCLFSVLTSWCLFAQAQMLEHPLAEKHFTEQDDAAKAQISKVLSSKNANPSAKVSAPQKRKVAKLPTKKSIAKNDSKKIADRSKTKKSATKSAPIAMKKQPLKQALAQAQTSPDNLENPTNNTSEPGQSSNNNSEDHSSHSSSADSNQSATPHSHSDSQQDNSSSPEEQSSQPENQSLPNYPSNDTNLKQSSTTQTQHWAVRIGTYSNTTDVKKSVALLQNHGFDGFIKEIKTGSKLISEVYVGPTKERSNAEKLNTKLKESHISGKVVPTDYDAS